MNGDPLPAFLDAKWTGKDGTAVEPEPKPIQAVPPGGRANIRGVPGGRIDALRRLLEA